MRSRSINFYMHCERFLNIPPAGRGTARCTWWAAVTFFPYFFHIFRHIFSTFLGRPGKCTSEVIFFPHFFHISRTPAPAGRAPGSRQATDRPGGRQASWQTSRPAARPGARPATRPPKTGWPAERLNRPAGGPTGRPAAPGDRPPGSKAHRATRGQATPPHTEQRPREKDAAPPRSGAPITRKGGLKTFLGSSFEMTMLSNADSIWTCVCNLNQKQRISRPL